MKFDKEQNLNSRVKTPETNGQITTDNEEQNENTENDVEDGNTQELENLKYVYII